MKKKILLIAGHGQGDPGACSTMNGVQYQEYLYTRELVNLLAGCFGGADAEVTVYDPAKNCYKQNKAGTGPDFKSYDYIFEVHFNAKVHGDGIMDGKFTGIGFYLHTGIRGVSVEQRILRNVVSLGFKQWGDGIFYTSGLLNCNMAYRAGVDYALLETAFIDDLDDMTWYNAHKKEVARAVADGIIDGFGIRKAQEAEAGPQAPAAPGWQRDETGWWYLDHDGTYPSDGWLRIGGRWYLFDRAGYMLKGLQFKGGKPYYLHEGPGADEGALMETDADGALTVFWDNE